MKRDDIKYAYAMYKAAPNKNVEVKRLKMLLLMVEAEIKYLETKQTCGK